jgi:hypothetical protein
MRSENTIFLQVLLSLDFVSTDILYEGSACSEEVQECIDVQNSLRLIVWEFSKLQGWSQGSFKGSGYGRCSTTRIARLRGSKRRV